MSDDSNQNQGAPPKITGAPGPAADTEGRRAELEALFAVWDDQSGGDRGSAGPHLDDLNEPGAREASLKLLDFGVRLRLIVSVILILVAGYFMFQTRHELAYWLADRQPTELGDLRARWVDEEANSLPHLLKAQSNSYASVQGLVVTRGASAESRSLFFCPLFNMVVTTPRELPEMPFQRLGFTNIAPELVPLVQRGLAFAGDLAVSFDAKGRLVRGDDIPEYLAAPVRFYADSLNLDPATVWVMMDGEAPEGQSFAAVLWALAAIVPLVSLIFLLRAIRKRKRERRRLQPAGLS